MGYVETLRDKILNRHSKIGIIGLGYVGLPLAREFLKQGFKVLGFDIDDTKVNMINAGQSYIKHIDSDFISHYREKGYLEATTDFKRLKEVDHILICVPTPLGKHNEPDLSYVLNTTRTISHNLRPGHHIVLESTTYPGTTEEELLPILEESGLKVGETFFLGYSPEREDPGNKKYTTANIPKVVSGITPSCLEITKLLYDQIVKETVPVSSTRIAESTKLLENIYRAVNIALVNELKIIFDRMGIDIWEVIKAASTKPFGFHPFYPGPGLGGHCIPIDPFYLTWKAREYGLNTHFIELAGEINTSMPYFVVDKTVHALNQHGKSLKGANILILGVAYKPDVDDMRESPALKIIELLREHGAIVDYNDPHIPELPPTRKYRYKMRSVPLTPEMLKKYDAIIITTNHTAYDYEMIAQHARLIVDTRNAMAGIPNIRAKLVKA